ncbi:MAG: hypothetical protein WKG03_22380 [Telluria sp.]
MITRFLLAAALCATVPSFAAEANRFAATAVPIERFDAGATRVERHGDQGAPLILIPAWPAARGLFRKRSVSSARSTRCMC